MKLHVTELPRNAGAAVDRVLRNLERGGATAVKMYQGAFEEEPEHLFQVIVSREPTGPDNKPRWHMSIAAMDRVPNWQEMVEFAHRLRPGVPFVMGLPPRSWWMNVHPNVLHLWESFDTELIEQWRFEAQGHEPS